LLTQPASSIIIFPIDTPTLPATSLLPTPLTTTPYRLCSKSTSLNYHDTLNLYPPIQPNIATRQTLYSNSIIPFSRHTRSKYFRQAITTSSHALYLFTITRLHSLPSPSSPPHVHQLHSTSNIHPPHITPLTYLPYHLLTSLHSTHSHSFTLPCTTIAQTLLPTLNLNTTLTQHHHTHNIYFSTIHKSSTQLHHSIITPQSIPNSYLPKTSHHHPILHTTKLHIPLTSLFRPHTHPQHLTSLPHKSISTLAHIHVQHRNFTSNTLRLPYCPHPHTITPLSHL